MHFSEEYNNNDYTNNNQPQQVTPDGAVYIAPGNVNEEKYRLATFRQFPTSRKLKSRKLAEAGFYFVGDEDATVCFSCGKEIRNWRNNYDPMHPSFHFNNCQMMRGNDPTNISMPSLLRLVHSDTTAQGPSRSLPSIPINLNHHGNDVSMEISESNQTEVKVASASANSTIYPSFSQPMRQKLVAIYPCKNAVNPHMQSFERRLETFDSRWNGDHLTATPRKIAEAGFFFLGESDRTKCWYCSGGLQNWEADDDAMFEHAKWFPECEFVLQTLGPQKVKEMFDNYPNIPRPPIAHPVNYKPGLQILENSLERSSDNVVECFLRGDIVHKTKQMGFQDDKISRVVRRRWEHEGSLFSTLDDILEALLNDSTTENSSDKGTREMNLTHTSVGVPLVVPLAASASNATEHGNPTTNSTNVPSIEQRINDRICKICKSNNANVVNLPCGHLSECEKCPQQNCVLCGMRVSEKLKVFLP